MDDELVADPLGLDHETFGTKWAKPDDLADDAVARNPNPRQLSCGGLCKGAKATIRR